MPLALGFAPGFGRDVRDLMVAFPVAKYASEEIKV
jgi:hypothetical protein